MNRIVRASLLVLLALPLSAADGKWTPEQVLQLDPAWLARQGLEIDPEALWNEEEGTGLLAAAIRIGGCSGAFVSPEGLIVTNHHCVFSMLQQNSTPENDIITNGYLARNRSEELPSRTIRVTVPRRFTDVTARIEAAIPANAGDAARREAIEDVRKSLVATCEETPGARCTVAAHDGGVQYVLVETFELPDVRLVYAPPRSVGEYGGEIDNWMWPRHTGDFAIVRVYAGDNNESAPHAAGNVPYRPRYFFPIAREGVGQGDFVMALGYPGTTYRALTADEMREREKLYFPRREQLYGEWIQVLEEESAKSEASRIALANSLKSLLNRYKNSQGQIAALERGSIVERQKASDEAVLAWARDDARHSGAVAAYEELRRIASAREATWEREFLLDQVLLGSKALRWGAQISRSARERSKDDAERDIAYQERNLPRLNESQEREQKEFVEAADKALLASFVLRALALPEHSRIAAVDRAFDGASSAAQIRSRIDQMYRGTSLDEISERREMLTEREAELRARRDPLLNFSLDLDAEMKTLELESDRRAGAIARLRPVWRRAVIAHAGEPVAYDANSTLRVTFGHVMGYRPRDGVFYTPFTTLSGMVAKHTGEEPFDAPEKILAAASKGELGRWKAPGLNDVPVDFLADLDTTGGNSGSPVLNGRGELVAVNFDRVWENVANDFGFNPEIARNISADLRYMFWILDEIENADALLKELDVAE